MTNETLRLINKWRSVDNVARAFAGWYNVNDVRRFIAYLDRQYQQNVLTYHPAISPEEEELYFAVMAWLNLRIVRGEYDDALGELYMLVGYPNRDRGQFFTPWSLARLMAEMQLPEDRAEAQSIASANPDGKISVFDPACGSGVMLCAAWDVARERGYADLVEFYGTDIDPYCVVMARVNLIMRREIPALVQGLQEWQALAAVEQMMQMEDRQEVLV